MHSSTGTPATGPRLLIEDEVYAAPLLRAGTRLLSLVLAVAAITNWSVNRTPPAGASKPWILIELG